MPAFAAIPILTTAGEIALPVLAREFAKRGGTAFIKTYGKAAFQAVTGGTAGAITYDQTINKSSIPQSSMPDATRMEQMDASMAVPNLYKDTGINRSVPVATGQGDYIGDTGQKEKERARIAEEDKERMKGSTPPVIKTWQESYPDLSGKIADSSPPPSTPEPIKIPQEFFPDLSEELNKPQILYNKDDSEFKYPTKEELENSVKETNKFWEEEIIPRENKKYPKLNIKNLPKIVEADKHFGAAAMSFSNFSESQLIYMSPQEYLDLTKRFRPVGKQGEGSKLNSDNIEQLLKDGKELANIPFLNVKKVGDSYEVTGQEGIHRAIAFKNLGYDKMPVVIEGTGKDKVAGVENKVYTATPKSYLYTEDWAKDYIGFIPKSIQSDGEVLLTKPEDFYNVRTKEKLFVKDSIAKQTDKLVPEKVELGPLSAVEKQTALALKGNKPDYYSRAVEAITNAKQDKSTKGKWKSIIQSNSTKEEMNYLGLTEFLQGNESATKEELLKLVKDKNIAPDLVLTKIPKGGQLDFSTFSIGGAGNTTGQYAIQISKDFDAESLSSSGIDIAEESEFGLSKKIYQATGAHLKEEYGRNTMAHARTQIGYNPTGDYVGFADLPEDSQIKETVTPVKQNASQELKNTFIVDEIQSDWIQDIQKFGTKEDYQIIKGSDMTEEFIEKNFGDKYELKISKFSTMKQTLEETGLQYNKVLYVTDRTTGIGTVLTNIDSDRYYTFSKTRITGASGFKTKEDAQKNAENKGIANLPITESKKYVELMLNSLIKEAVLNGTDSIGITNGQIQGDRYEGQGDEESEGLKNFYDKIVIPQLEKIAQQYGVKDQIKKVTISEPEFSEDDDIKSIPNRMKMSMQNGFVLKKVRGDILYATLNDSKINIPDFFTIYSDSGRAQGHSRIMDVIENDEPSVAERLNNPKQYFIWVKQGSALSETLSNRPNDMITLRDYVDNSTVDFSMPITIANPGNNLTTPEDDASEGTTNMTNYSSYILDYKNKGIDLSYEHDEHQIIKMPLPKKLQKDILSKPIKLSKVKTQANRLTA